MTKHIDGFPVSANTYRRQACRCTGCCGANTAAGRAYNARRVANSGVAPGPPRPWREKVEQAIARTGSISAAVDETGASWDRVWSVWDAMDKAASE